MTNQANTTAVTSFFEESEVSLEALFRSTQLLIEQVYELKAAYIISPLPETLVRIEEQLSLIQDKLFSLRNLLVGVPTEQATESQLRLSKLMKQLNNLTIGSLRESATTSNRGDRKAAGLSLNDLKEIKVINEANPNTAKAREELELSNKIYEFLNRFSRDALDAAKNGRELIKVTEICKVWDGTYEFPSAAWHKSRPRAIDLVGFDVNIFEALMAAGYRPKIEMLEPKKYWIVVHLEKTAKEKFIAWWQQRFGK